MKQFFQMALQRGRVVNLLFFAGNLLGIELAFRFESTSHLDDLLFRFDFISLVVTTIGILLLSILLVSRLYGAYTLLLSSESENHFADARDIFASIGLAILMGFALKFVFQSFWLIVPLLGEGL